MPLLLAQRAKAFQCELNTLLDESRRGSAAISTTVSGRWWRFKTSLISSMRLDPIAWDHGGIEGVWGWGHTGTVRRLGERSKDVCSTGEEVDATVGMDVVMRSGWPWCPEISGFSGEFWEQWELEEMHILVPNRPMIGTGRLPPMLCRPGKEKQRRALPCSPLWQTCLSGKFRRHRTDCSRFRLEDAIRLDWVDWFETEHRPFLVCVLQVYLCDPFLLLKGCYNGEEHLHFERRNYNELIQLLQFYGWTEGTVGFRD